MRLAMIAHRLRLVALGALFALGLVSGARAQDNFPTPGGATVPGYVTMCISGNIAVPCNPGGGGGGGLAAGAAVTGCPAQSSLFVTSALALGCVAPVSETDTGLVFSVSGILALPDTASSTVGLVTMGGSRFLHDQNANSNVFLGHNAYNFTGISTQSTCVGESCMLGGVSGAANTCIGRFCMGGAVTGNSNTAVGSGSMGGLTSGGQNIGIGAGANGVTTASNTTCIGYGSCGAATGANTSAFGFQAGLISTGANNSFLGNQAGNATVAGNTNTFVGSLAGATGAAGNGNTIVGQNCLAAAAQAATVVLGNAGCAAMLDFAKTTAAVWTFLGGTIAAPLATDATHTDATVCRDTTSGQFFFGSGTLGACTGTSGRQFKRDIEPMNPVLDEIMKLDFVTYRYRDGYGDNGARQQLGLVAQDVEKVWPALAGHNDNGDTINYDFGAVLMMYGKAIQELKAANDDLRAEVRILQARAR